MNDILYQEKQSTETKNYGQLTVNFATAFHKPSGLANPYILFLYEPHTIYNNTQGQVTGSMNTDLIDANKQANNKRRKYDS